MPLCPRCAGLGVKKDGRDGETQRYRCRSCRRTCIGRTGTPFAGHPWPREVIVMAVRWYLRYRLSAADVRDLLAERGVDVAARTVLYWVQQCAPLLARAGRRAATRPGRRWWCDETSVRVGGKWASLYRAIDEAGQVVDVLLRTHRDRDSARACFVLATYRRHALPEEVITDKHPAYARAVRDKVPGATHTQERATPQERAGHQIDRAVPCSHEGSPATDARAAVHPYRATCDRRRRAGAGGATGPRGRAGYRGRGRGRPSRAGARRRDDLRLAR